MYVQYFGLNEKPFSIAPDPRYLYQSERHAEALAHLLYGVEEAGGFIQLTGEVGTGKTTLIRVLLNRMPLNVEVAMILNPRLSVKEFLQNICEELQLDWPVGTDSIKELIDAINRYLLDAHAAGRRVVLIIDEAQNLDADLLEQLRLLTNLETSERKLLQIILIGQPELRQTLARTDLRQLAQRITGRYHLDPLSREDTANYINHRLQVAGANREIFTSGAVREIHRLSEGIPRLINVISDRAMLGAYGREKATVDTRLAREAAAEVQGRVMSSPATRWIKAAAVVAALALASGLVYQYWTKNLLPGAAQANALAGPAPVESLATPASAELAKVDKVSDQAAELLDSPVATPAPAKGMDEAPEVFDLSELLATTEGLTDNDTAFVELFRLWDSAYVPGGNRACTQAAAQGLKCLFQRGSWNHLVTLNLPAVLALTDAGGVDHQVVLASLLDDERALLRIGETSYPIAINQLTDMWFGDSLLLWRPHAGADQLLGPGARGAGVRWLREGLHKLDKTPAPTAADPTLYDDTLAEQVRRFQRDYGLRVDGIAGERTLVKLQALLLEPGVPLLATGG